MIVFCSFTWARATSVSALRMPVMPILAHVLFFFLIQLFKIEYHYLRSEGSAFRLLRAVFAPGAPSASTIGYTYHNRRSSTTRKRKGDISNAVVAPIKREILNYPKRFSCQKNRKKWSWMIWVFFAWVLSYSDIYDIVYNAIYKCLNFLRCFWNKILINNSVTDLCF